IPSSKVFENSNFLAFLDFSPVSKGHTLLIPKKHYETLMDLPDELLKDISVQLKEISSAVMRATNCEGISISQSNNKAAGQVVPHIHFHIIPRFVNDSLKQWPQGKYEDGEMDNICKKIVSFL
ncbi:MAG: HIT domain-containing protein, partial [Candidatus Woesearchaeota archaeon]